MDKQGSLLQLKPANESFIAMSRGIKEKFTAIIICEEPRDAEILKAVIRKLGIEYKGVIAVTHGEGIPSIYELLSYVSVLARLSRKLKALGLVVDSEDMIPSERMESIINSLRSRLNCNINIIEKDDENQFYHIEIVLDDKILPLLIAISGDQSFGFKRHNIEEHLLKLGLLDGRIKQTDISSLKDPKQVFTSDDEILKLIQSSNSENIREAFKHLTKLLLRIKSII